MQSLPVSIHAPTWGATNLINFVATVIKFQSTHPRGVRLPDEESYKKFDASEFGDLPNTIIYGWDIDQKNQQEMVTVMKLKQANTLPIFLIADTFNRVVFVSQGYTIGLGAQMMQVIHKL